MAVNDDVYSATTPITPGYGPHNQNQTQVPKPPAPPRNVLAKPREQKPSYQEFTPPSFEDFAARRAVEDNIPSLANADAAVLRNYAKEYAEKVLPGAVLSKHGKVDKNYISTMSEALQTNVHKNQDQWKAYFKALEEKNKSPTPPNTGSMYGRNFLPGPLAQNLGDITQSAIGATSSALGGTVGGIAHLGDKAINALYPQSVLDAVGYDKNGLGNVVQPFVEQQEQAGKLAQEQTSPQFQQAVASNAPWSKTLVASRIANTVGSLAPLTLAAGTGAIPAAVAGAGQFGQQSKDERVNEIRSMPKAEIVKSPRIQALLAQGMPLDQAREQVAQAAGEGAFGVGATVGGILGFTSPLTAGARNVLAKVVGKSLPARIAAGSLAEGATVGTGMGAAQRAANIETGQALGDQNYPTMRGVPEAVGQGAFLGGIVGGLGAAGNTRIPNVRDALRFGGKREATPETPSSTTPQGVPPEPTAQAGPILQIAKDTNVNASPDVVTSAVKQATAENPIPPPEVLKDPGQAQASYAKWEETVQADLMGGEGWTEAQFEAARPDLRRAWADEAKVNPAILEEKVATPTEEALTPEELNQVAPADVRAVQEPTIAPAEARGQMEPTTPAEAAIQPGVDESYPVSLREVAAEDVQNTTGQVATPEQINAQLKVHEAAYLDGTNTLLPEQTRLEAISRILKKGNEPTPEAVNKFAENIAKKRAREAKDNVLKKAEAGTQVSEPAKIETIRQQADENTSRPEFNNLRQEVAKLGKSLDKGKITDEEFSKFTRQAAEKSLEATRAKRYEGALKDRTRGPEWVEERLLRAKRSGELSSESVDLAQWLLRKNPNVAKDLAVSIGATKDGRQVSGAYNPYAKMVKLFTEGTNDGTIVHEVMHHAERMMPEEVQRGIIEEWSNALHSSLKEANSANDKARTDALLNLSIASVDKRAFDKAIKSFSDGVLSYDKDYQLINPSEFWAVNATRILEGKFGRQAWHQKAIDWLKEFIEKVKSAFGLRSDSPVLKGLNDILASKGEHIAGARMLAERAPGVMEAFRYMDIRKERVAQNTAERVAEAIKIRSKPTEKELNEVEKLNQLSSAEKFQEQWVNSLGPLRNINQKLLAKGIKVGRNANVFDEGTRLQATSRHATTIAEQKFVEPAINWAVKKALSLKQDPVEFTDNLSQWYMGKHNLEVNERGFLEDARLKKASAIERDAVVQQWMRGELQQGQYLEKLRAIVNKPGALVSDRDVLPKSEMTDLAAKILVAKARKAGITPEIIQEFEPYRQGMVDAIAKNGLDSGKFSLDDAARVSGIGSKYYVPSKGFAEGEVNGLDFQKLKSGAFGKTYTALEGRDTIAKNPLLSLMQDTIRSAKDVAENKFTKTVYNWAKEHGKDFGVSTETHNIEKEMRDAVAAGKGLNDISKIYDRENVVIHNAGNYRFIIRFPENSPYLKSIKSLSAAVEPSGKFQELAKKFTNSQGYLATVARPKYVFWNALWNDFFGNLGQVTVDYGPGAGISFAKNYIGKGGALRGLSYYFKGGKATTALEREQIAADPNATKFAKIMQKFVQHGGDLSFDQMQNATRSIYALSKRLEEATSKKASFVKKRDAVLSYLEQAGNVSNMTGRVAAYEMYMAREGKKLERTLGRKLTAEETNNLESDAVLYARRILDFLQTSEKGRALNAHYMFARMAITQADRLISSVKDAKGNVNYKKLGLIMAAGNAFGAMLYGIMSQVNPLMKEQDDSTVASKFTIPFGDKVITIPMGYGPTKLLLVPGIMAMRWALGHTTGKDAMLTVRNMLIENLTPFKPSASTPGESTGDHIMDLVEGAFPTYVRPVSQSIRNKTIFGSSITAEPKFVDDKAFRSDSGRYSTPGEWKWLAQTLNKVSGGSIDLFPETLEYLVGAYGSGPANDLMRGIATMQKKSEGLDIEPQKLPFAPTIFSNDSEYYAQRKLKDLEASLIDDSKRMDYAKKQGDQAVSLLKQRDPQIETKLATLKRINSIQAKFNKDRKDIEKDKLMNAKTKQAKMQQLSKDFKKEATAIIGTR